MFYFLPIVITRFTSPLAHTLLNVNPEQNYHKILQKGKIGTYCFSSIIKVNSSHISMADWARFDADADSSGDVAEFLTLAQYIHDLWSGESGSLGCFYLVCPVLYSLWIGSLGKLLEILFGIDQAF